MLINIEKIMSKNKQPKHEKPAYTGNVPKELFVEILKTLKQSKNYAGDLAKLFPASKAVQEIATKLITDLNAEHYDTITDEAVSKLTNLTSLNLLRNEAITIEGISELTNLTSLNILCNNNIPRDYLAQLQQGTDELSAIGEATDFSGDIL